MILVGVHNFRSVFSQETIKRVKRIEMAGSETIVIQGLFFHLQIDRAPRRADRTGKLRQGLSLKS